MYRPIYYFRASNGTTLKEYTCESKSASTSYPSLNEKKVYYKLENPNDCLTEYDTNSAFVLYFVLFIPISCIITGIVMIITQIKANSGQNSNNNDYNYNPDFTGYDN